MITHLCLRRNKRMPTLTVLHAYLRMDGQVSKDMFFEGREEERIKECRTLGLFSNSSSFKGALEKKGEGRI